MIVMLIMLLMLAGFFVGYTFAYFEIVNRAFASKANNEPMEIISGNKKAIAKIEHIEVKK